MDKTMLRPLVFDILRRTPQTHLHAIENEVRQKVEGYERGDALAVQEAVWDLLLQGVLAPGKNSLNLHLPFVHVTEYGQRCLEEETIAVYDPDGYVARLRADTEGKMSVTALETARDALLAFQRGLFRASLVLLSRAAVAVLEETGSAQAPPSAAGEPWRVELVALASLAHQETLRPRLPEAERETALGRLFLFPAQCRSAYTLLARPRRGRASSGA